MCLVFVVEKIKVRQRGAGRSIWVAMARRAQVETQRHVIRTLSLIVVCVLFVCVYLLEALLGGGRYLLPPIRYNSHQGRRDS